MTTDTQQTAATQKIAAAVGPASTPTPILDGTRRVSIGPVARKLSKRRKHSRQWIPQLFMAIAVLACGGIVFAAVKQFEKNGLGASALTLPLENNSSTAIESTNNIEKDSSSQVRSVIELVGAFENLKTKDAEEENPLDLPNEDSPTAQVAVYTPSTVSHIETEDFLNQIHMNEGLKLSTSTPLSDSQPEPETTEEPELAEVAADETPASDVAPEALNDAPAAESVVVVDNSEEAVTEETAIEVASDVDSPAVDQLLSQTEEEAPHQIADAIVEHTDSSVEPEVAPAAEALATENGEELVVDESETNTDEVVATDPTSQETPEVENALAAYNKALSNLNDAPADRTLSRRYYATLAELAHVSHTHESAEGMQAISDGIHADSTIFDLASSAASSWIRWPKRKSPGVVVAGKIQTVVNDTDGVLVGIQTNDRRSSVVSVLIVNEDQDVTSLSNRVGEDIGFAGIVTDEQLNGSPLVVGSLLITQ